LARTTVRLSLNYYTLLLAETDISGARTVAEYMRQTIEDCTIHRIDAQENIGGITISIGVAEYTSGNSLVDLLGHADKALYASKKQGRNRTTVYADPKAL
jgi:diguanylate cyclase (GGDEF)-like protein